MLPPPFRPKDEEPGFPHPRCLQTVRRPSGQHVSSTATMRVPSPQVNIISYNMRLLTADAMPIGSERGADLFRSKPHVTPDIVRCHAAHLLLRSEEHTSEL